jgi:hypothetical protein
VGHFDLGDHESQLVRRIYDAALDSQGWGGVMQSIADACDADQCTMFFYDARCRGRNFAAAAKINEGIVKKYLQEFIDLEAAEFHKNMAPLREGQVVTSDELIAITGKTYDAIVGRQYMETFLPQLQFQAGIILLHENMMCAGLGIRSFIGKPSLTPDKLAFLGRISQHLVQSVKIHNRINVVKQTNLAIEAVLKHINLGVFLLDKELQVRFSNGEAARILESGCALEIGRYGKLFLTSAADNLRLQAALESVAGQNPGEQAVQFAAQGAQHRLPLRLSIASVQATQQSELAKEGIALVIFAIDPDRPNRLPESYVRQAWSLTPTECSIMKILLKNSCAHHVAEARGTTLETARGQLKVIMQKTGTHSQAELSRLLMAISN